MIDPLEVISGVSLDDLSGKLSAGNLDPKELERAALMPSDSACSRTVGRDAT